MGWRVIVVFDAYMMPGIEKKKRTHDVEVLFTRENETADERIEKLVSELSGRRVQIHVATSDLTEQWIIFAQGALRKSARELEVEMKEITNLITKSVKNFEEQRPVSKIDLTDEIKEIFEKWRRGINKQLTLKFSIRYTRFIAMMNRGDPFSGKNIHRW